MDLNKTMLIGRLGNDPELKYTQSGIAVVAFSIATSMQWKDQTGDKQEKTEWHNIKAWKGLAETCGKYLKKGSKVYVEGRLETSTWETEGKKNYKTEIVLDNMIMLDGKKEESKTETKAETPKGDLPF